jgi:hypothetical protein
MSVALYMRSKMPPISKNEFENYPAFSVALDGYCKGLSWLSRAGIDHGQPLQNFNHHEGADRLGMRATCGQVDMAIRHGFFKLFQKNGEPYARLWANHCDEDICLSVYLLKNGHREDVIENPLLDALVTAVDKIDTSSGAYPFSLDDPILEKIAWIFNPYYRLKLSGNLDERRREDYVGVVDRVGARLEAYISGKGKSMAPDFRYEKENGGKGWYFIKEIGAQARLKIFADGIDFFVTVRKRSDGKYSYTLLARSRYVLVNIPAIYRYANMKEGIGQNDSDTWGGADDRGGSPMIKGSSLSPKELAFVINKAKDL